MLLASLYPMRLRGQISPGPLARAHATLEGSTNCVQCHGLKREPMTQLCLACHRDIKWLMDAGRGFHGREVKQSRKECASCHPDHAGAAFALIAWPEAVPARFDHRKAGWALEDKHAEAKCEACHDTKYRIGQAATLSKRTRGAGWLGLETQCIACHKSDDVHRNSLGQRCESCHDAKTWEKATGFDHERSDYPLTGKHADVVCDKCHLVPKLGIKVSADGKRIPVFKPVPFKECSSCHADPHKGRLSARCSECHVTRGFGVVNAGEFNHALTRYPLKGKHASVECAACHGANLAVKAPGFSTCAACHKDVHNGSANVAGAPVDCDACHRVEGFTPSTFTLGQHAKSPYPLEGKHILVKCVSCHTPLKATGAAKRVARLRMPFASCGDCHADVHGGQLAARADRGTCEACHGVKGFTPSTYRVDAHAALRLALTGKHATIACAACHGVTRPGLDPHPATLTLGTARVALTIRERECEGCHVDSHAGRFQASGERPLTGGCGVCHDAASFRPAVMTLAVHAGLGFALDGAHRAVPCVQCHESLRPPATRATSTLLRSARGVAQLTFGEKRSSCKTCHETPHGNQFDRRADSGKCESCHGVDAFAPTTTFNHDRDTAFKLDGAHVRVTCAACHKAPKGSTVVAWRGVSAKCESCHGGTVPRGAV